VNKEYYRPDEIADMLRISKDTVYRLINREQNPLKAYQVGGSIRVNKSDFDDWLKGNEIKPFE
jgi:excisionase family DNA binding protein